jgi:hypothetical protein
MRFSGRKNMILNSEQIQELTHKKKATSQARELIAMQIPFRRRRDGSIVVLQEDLYNASKKEGQAPPTLRLSA